MGITLYQKEIEALFQKSPVVDFRSLERLVHAQNPNVKQYVKLLVHNLLLQGKIKRLTKGYYSRTDDPSLLVFCMKPAYLGLQDALSVHNLWEQETIPIIITTQKVRQGIRSIFGTNVLIRRIDKNYSFGIEYIQQEDFYFPYSDIEKTLIDMVYFKQYLRSDVLKKMRKRVDTKKLKLYLSHYPKKFQQKVIGILEK
ncbi:MAG: hypothetical protein AABX98_04135 [Nanoarchaeota archaeon]